MIVLVSGSPVITHRDAIPVKLDAENSQKIVESGDLGYWPQGDAFRIFFGPTPASHGDEIRPASPVNPIGQVLGNLEPLKKSEGRRSG